MATLKVIAAVLALSAALPGAAHAQAAPPLTGRELAGNWTLRIIPDRRPGVTVSTDRPDMPLTIATRADGGLSCRFGDDPGECRIRDGDLIATWTDSGAAMIFTLTDRARDGFTGAMRIRARLLPFGSVHIGAVNMIRR